METIGDCYMAAGGLMRVDEQTGATGVLPEGEVDPLHAVRTVQFAKVGARAVIAVLYSCLSYCIRKYEDLGSAVR